jgi:hypothetical protein
MTTEDFLKLFNQLDQEGKQALVGSTFRGLDHDKVRATVEALDSLDPDPRQAVVEVLLWERHEAHHGSPAAPAANSDSLELETLRRQVDDSLQTLGLIATGNLSSSR